jgi:phage regulator Rha-like protein
MASRSVDSFIRLVRGQRVILDEDLARIYGVTTARLNQQVKRNIDRFPTDFVFQLTAAEFAGLMLQSATSNKGRGGRRKLPNAFTEHGAIMAASVLNSRTAVHMSVFVVRAFVKMREVLAQNSQLAAKLAELERRLTDRLDVHEKAIVHILDEIRKLMAPPPLPVPERRQIGFHVRAEAASVSALARRHPLKRHSKGARPDTLYKAKPVGRSQDRRSAAHHDAILYPR